MARFKKHLDKFDWHDIKATTSDSGRIYHTPGGDAPSVTTILGSLPNPELDAWRERVGEDEANRISKDATDLGTLMHDSLEAHLLGNEYVPNPDCNPDEHLKMALEMAQAIKLFGWRKLREVWAVELPLHFYDVYAGRTDLIGLYDGTAAIMDYKTSKFIKAPKYLEKYRLQLAFYSIAAEHMFGVQFNIGINFFAIRPSREFNKPAESHVVYMDEKMMREYKVKAVEVLIDFYQERDPSKLDKIETMIDII